MSAWDKYMASKACGRVLCRVKEEGVQREMKMCAGSWHAWIDNAYASHDKAAQKCYEQAVEEWTLDSRNYKDCRHCPWNLGLGLSQACGRECRVNKGGDEE